MKSIGLIITALFFSVTVFGQKFAFIDTDYVLENVPEYAMAQKELDDLAVKWQNQIEAKYAEIDKLYKSYQAEQVLLTEDMKRKREEEIIIKEKEVKDYQKDKFGVDGALFKRRQELVKPIQDEIYRSLKEIATTENFAIVFDKSAQSNVMYANARYDISDDVLKKLGYDKEDE